MNLRSLAAPALALALLAPDAFAQAIAEYTRTMAPGQAAGGAVGSMGDATRRQTGRATVSLSGGDAGSATSSAPAKAAPVRITSNVEGGRVVIGGLDRGPLPVRDLALEPGTYSVHVSKYGYRDLRTKLEVKEGRPAALDARLEKIR